MSMDTLRDRLRQLLDARAPRPSDWAQQEARLLDLVAPPPRHSRAWWALPAFLPAAALLWLFLPHPPAPPAADVVEISLRRASEPASAALHISITIHPG